MDFSIEEMMQYFMAVTIISNCNRQLLISLYNLSLLAEIIWKSHHKTTLDIDASDLLGSGIPVCCSYSLSWLSLFSYIWSSRGRFFKDNETKWEYLISNSNWVFNSPSCLWKISPCRPNPIRSIRCFWSQNTELHTHSCKLPSNGISLGENPMCITG